MKATENITREEAIGRIRDIMTDGHPNPEGLMEWLEGRSDADVLETYEHMSGKAVSLKQPRHFIVGPTEAIAKDYIHANDLAHAEILPITPKMFRGLRDCTITIIERTPPFWDIHKERYYSSVIYEASQIPKNRAKVFIV